MIKNPVRHFATLAIGSCAALTLALGGASSAHAACNNGVQDISKRKNISCKQAIAVSRQLGNIPECRGQVRRKNGWLMRGIPRRGEIVAARVSKGSRAFTIGGCGVC